MSSSICAKDAKKNRESIKTAQEALRRLPEDRERVIREAHARWLAEKQKREANNALS